MMKTLLLLRHAKSSWKDTDLDDHDRPLNKRGKNEAPRMGRQIFETHLTPDFILCSTAKRARRTADAVIEETKFRGEVRFSIEVYHADRAHLVHLVHETPEQYARVLVVGHNPGLEEFLELITGKCEPLPTAALAEIALDIATWREFSASTRGELKNLWQPRELP